MGSLGRAGVGAAADVLAGGAMILAGVVRAAMNTSGQIGSILSPLLVTFLLRHFSDWNLPLFAMGGLFLVGAVCSGLIHPHQRIFD